MTADDIATAYGCPPSVADAMAEDATTRLLQAVRKLGPERVQWLSDPAPKRLGHMQHSNWTAWALDGHRATHAQIISAAK